uniref:Uncharacterized protein n=1 Tax=Parascaris univalens TaxID=6257 RepID=A0A915BQW5_PARUN
YHHYANAFKFGSTTAQSAYCFISHSGDILQRYDPTRNSYRYSPPVSVERKSFNCKALLAVFASAQMNFHADAESALLRVFFYRINVLSLKKAMMVYLRIRKHEEWRSYR